ncbi:MAG TPA: phosphoethanolamine transferase domain-containing protein, partial [Methylophilaceae bacterium]|nr:phosphoethanolamine transferase domain-containing protein [Methylophilaceae bacterium]
MLKSRLIEFIKKPIGATLAVTAFVMLTANVSLFKHIVEIYPLTWANLPFLISLTIFFSILTMLFFMLVGFGKVSRWLVALLLILAAQAAYYMDSFGVLMDVVMIDNITQTDAKEVAGLLNFSMVLRTVLLGVVPALFVIKYWPKITKLSTELKTRLIWLVVLLAALVTVVLPFTAGYASFIREHKITRFYANPTYPVYSLIKYAGMQFQSKQPTEIKKIAEDAKFLGPVSRHELIIVVVGETARADRFSLNGYQRETNPLLAKEDIVSFSKVSSCGTSTGVSVPCMFSALAKKDYDKNKALSQENALDVLIDNGIEVLW